MHLIRGYMDGFKGVIGYQGLVVDPMTAKFCVTADILKWLSEETGWTEEDTGAFNAMFNERGGC